MFDIARCIEMMILLGNSLQYSDLSSDNHSDPRSLDIHLRNVLLHLHAQSGGLHSYTERRSGNNISGPRRGGQLPVQTVSQEAGALQLPEHELSPGHQEAQALDNYIHIPVVLIFPEVILRQ